MVTTALTDKSAAPTKFPQVPDGYKIKGKMRQILPTIYEEIAAEVVIDGFRITNEIHNDDEPNLGSRESMPNTDPSQAEKEMEQ